MDVIAYDCDIARLDFARVHGWLTETYWSPGISRELVERGFQASTAVCGAYIREELVGVARVVSDTTRFAYLADVYVDAAHRNRGIARGLVRTLVAHPLLAQVGTWLLRTRDAHGVYAPLGFARITDPERYMVWKRPAG